MKVNLANLAGFFVFLLALQNCLPIPVRYSWILNIAVTEWGHWLAPIALLLAVILLRWRSTRPGAWAGLLAAMLFSVPVFSACCLEAALERQDWGEGHPVQSPLVLSSLYTGVPIGPYRMRALEYSPGLKLDLYEPPSGIPTTCVLIAHGGSWSRGSRRDRSALNGLSPYLASRGYAVASLDYALAPSRPFPAAVDTLLEARQFLGQQFPHLRRFAWMGRSSGAHLALLSCYRAHDEMVIAFYGPTEMVWSWNHPSNPLVLDSHTAQREFLGGSPQERPDAYREASPLEQLQSLRHTPRTLLIHGMQDELVYPEQSWSLESAYHDGNCQTLLLPWANHGADINLSGPTGQVSTYVIERFLGGPFSP